MMQSVQSRVAAWRRRRRATQIQHVLAQAGYTADDLIALAQLRATVDLEPVAPMPPADPAHPSLSDVLGLWRSGGSARDAAVAQRSAPPLAPRSPRP